MTDLVFVVDGDVAAAQMARDCLEKIGYAVRSFSTAVILEDVEECRPSLLLIAATLPDGSGRALCREIRKSAKLAATPVVLLTDTSSEEERIAALDAGADDCLAKPFSLRELAARAQAVLRRRPRPLPIPIAERTDMVIDRSAMKVSIRGNEVATTALEFRLVDYLAWHRGRVFTRDVLLDAVWGDMQFVTPRSVDACIRRVRDKIEPDRANPTFLKTIRGVGYRFDAFAAWPSLSEACHCAACAPSGTVKHNSRLGLVGRRRAAER